MNSLIFRSLPVKIKEWWKVFKAFAHDKKIRSTAWVYKHETLAGGFGTAVIIVAHAQYGQRKSGKDMDARVDALELRLKREMGDIGEKITREIKEPSGSRPLKKGTNEAGERRIKGDVNEVKKEVGKNVKETQGAIIQCTGATLKALEGDK